MGLAHLVAAGSGGRRRERDGGGGKERQRSEVVGKSISRAVDRRHNISVAIGLPMQLDRVTLENFQGIVSPSSQILHFTRGPNSSAERGTDWAPPCRSRPRQATRSPSRLHRRNGVGPTVPVKGAELQHGGIINPA